MRRWPFYLARLRVSRFAEGFTSEAEPSDKLKDVTVYHKLDGCL